MRKLLRLRDVMERTAMSRSNVYLKISRGQFPKQIHLGERCSRWVEDDVEAWIEQKIKGDEKWTK